jgi:hypothetical protein
MVQPQFQLDPKLPFAAKINPLIAMAQSVDAQRPSKTYAVAADMLALQQSYDGDSLVAIDFTIPGTNRKWVDTTETEGLVYLWYASQGMVITPELAAEMEANRGPEDQDAPWNMSYRAAGCIPGVPGIFPVQDVIDVATKTVIKGIVVS